MIPTPSLTNAAAWFAQIAIVAAAAALLPAIFRLHAPGVRYYYWRATLALCLALPWLQGRVTARPTAVASAARSTILETAAPAASTAAPAAPVVDWIPLALAIGAFGIVARLVWMAAGVVRLRRLRNAGEPADDCAELDEIATLVGRCAEVRYVGSIRHPVTFGAVRPVILLPASLRDQSAEIRRAVLAHELLHVERRDWAWLVGEELLRAIFWFHPAVWWLVNRVQLAREEVVDELAVTVTGRRRAYVEALLAFADEAPLAATAFARQRHLFKRMILISREVAMSSTRIAASSMAMVLLVLAGAAYATRAFPLHATIAAAPAVQSGLLEQRANQVTPENPVPRRLTHVEVPGSRDADALGISGGITLVITLDSQGRVAEARPVALRLHATNPSINMSFENAEWANVQRSLREAAGQTRLPEAVDAVVADAVAAVKQWQYDPPFEPPLKFRVTVWYGPPPPPPPPPPVQASVTRGRGGRAGPPPPPPPAPVPARRTDAQLESAPDGAVRVGGGIKAPTKIRDVRPVYPPIAQAARVQGVVIVEARIERDGRVGDARVMRSIPLLDQAAIDAVMQWEFTPTLLNGVPVPVIMTLTVNFALQ